MAMASGHFDAQQRAAEKQQVRSADLRSLRSGAKSSAQLKRESESFAFPKGRARINLKSARSLV